MRTDRACSRMVSHERAQLFGGRSASSFDWIHGCTGHTGSKLKELLNNNFEVCHLQWFLIKWIPWKVCLRCALFRAWWACSACRMSARSGCTCSEPPQCQLLFFWHSSSCLTESCSLCDGSGCVPWVHERYQSARGTVCTRALWSGTALLQHKQHRCQNFQSFPHWVRQTAPDGGPLQYVVADPTNSQIHCHNTDKQGHLLQYESRCVL